MKKLKDLEKRLGIKFKNPQFLEQALIHRSYLNEGEGLGLHSNERLEFLGDSILSFVVSGWLFKEFPDYPEGELTNFRSNMVRTTALARLAKKVNLGDYLFLGQGEKIARGGQKSSILANTVEAIIGAFYLDQGIEASRHFIKKQFAFLFQEFFQKGEFKDAKSLLQEKLQAKEKETPFYKILREKGPDHNRIFTAGVYCQKRLLAKGTGKSKQAAEEAAAKKVLQNLKL